MDRIWWDYYLPEVKRVFKGELFAPMSMPGVTFLSAVKGKAKNSGAGTMLAAAHFGARRIFMLGFDCKKTGGRAHWHPDHSTKAFGKHRRGMGNCGSLPRWPQDFTEVAQLLRGLEIFNCSRVTALTMFPRRTLEECLEDPARG